MYAFGSFAPFGAQWRSIGRWGFGGRSESEFLYSLRFDVLSQLRAGGPYSPDPATLRARSAAPSHGFLRLRVQASRRDSKVSTDFFCDASGVDIYANHVHVELWAPLPIGAARDNSEASQGGGLGVLDEAVAPSVTRIGSSLRGTATLHTYAQAGEAHPVPPRATRYSVLSGEQPTFYIAGTVFATTSPASGAAGGVSGLRLTADSVIAWEVAP